MPDIDPKKDSDHPFAADKRSAVDKMLDRIFVPIQISLVGLLLVGIFIGVIQGKWVSHCLNTSVWIQGDWQVGEYRSCQLLLTTARLFCGSWENTLHGGSLSEFISQVSNDDFEIAFDATINNGPESEWMSLGKYFHALHVTFHGRFQRSDRERVVIPWLCDRKGDALDCKTPK